MNKWFTLPGTIPAPGDICWLRVEYYYSDPFLALFVSVSIGFTSIDNTITYPPYVVARWRPAAGSDLITNGNFTSSANWNLDSGWSIASGKASFDSSDFAKIGQDIVLSAGKKYLLQFEMLDCASFSRFAFVNENSDPLFYGSWSSYTLHNNGVYSVELICAVDSEMLRIGAFQGDPSFSITAISLRELY